MDKEVVVTADVDEEEELLYKVFKFVNLLWLYGLILGETLEEARKISLDQGDHEQAVTCGGEADLHRQILSCKKNPGHRHFIPVKDFKIEHLPPSHRNKVIYDWIRANADLTCRLKVEYTSYNRPKYHPIRDHLLYPFSKVQGDFIRTGTGYVERVEAYTEEDNKNCECDRCESPGTHTPHKVWGKVTIATATHVVYDDDEARRTTCYFGYDTKTTLLPKCLKLTGLRMENSKAVADVCKMTYITHDMNIIKKLHEMCFHLTNIKQQLCVKYRVDEVTSMHIPAPVVIISHPHGCSKHITVGMWTYREMFSVARKQNFNGWEHYRALTRYTYNTYTCPGSSGAPVLRLPVEKGMFLILMPHYHSEGGQGNTNNNKSVVGAEIVELPTLSEKRKMSIILDLCTSGCPRDQWDTKVDLLRQEAFVEATTKSQNDYFVMDSTVYPIVI